MYPEARCDRKWRQLAICSFMTVATLVLGSACDRAASVDRERLSVNTEIIGVDGLRITAVDSTLMFQYRTRIAAQNCKGQQAEMPQVWRLVVKAALRDSQIRRVILMPEDSVRSVSFEFTKGASGVWSADAPCVITIPVN